MKRKYLVLIFSLLIGIGSFAGTEPAWRKNFAGKVNWQKVTSYGNLIVGTQSGLYSINPDNGNVVWEKINFAAIDEASVQEVENAPFFSVQLADRMVMVDMFKGTEVFDSKKAGIAELMSTNFLYQCGGILISGKPAPNTDPILLMVDMATGETLWKLDDKIGDVIAVNELTKEEVLVVTFFTNYKIKSRKGEIIWKKATSKETESMNPQTAKLLMAFAKELTGEEIKAEIDFFQDEERDMFVLGSTEKEERMATGSTTPTITYKSNYSLYKISDGSILWNNPVEVTGRVSQLIFDDNGIIILPEGGNQTKVNLYDYATGQGKWGKKGNGIGVKGGIYDYVPTEKGILLVSVASGNYLSLLDPILGILKFDKPVKINGEVMRTISLPKGLLYITTEEMNILDPSTGSLLLSKSVNTKPQLTMEDENMVYAYDLKTKELMAVDKATSTVKTLSKAPIKFEGKEDPASLEYSADGLLLTSEQNIAMIDLSGDLKFQNYYPAPKEPGLKKALLYAQAVRAAYIGANAYYASAALQNAANKTDDAVSGAVYQGFGEVYGQIGDQANDFVKESLKQASARHKATASGRDFMFMMIDTESKDNALVLVNKKTGKIDSSVNLGKEKAPNYAVDDVTSQIYYRVSENEIVSYKF